MSTEKMEPVAAIDRKFLRPEWIGPASHWDATAQVVGLDCVRASLRAAVAAERERCAKLIESLPSFHQEAPAVFKQCAAAIRQLGDEQ